MKDSFSDNEGSILYVKGYDHSMLSILDIDQFQMEYLKYLIDYRRQNGNKIVIYGMKHLSKAETTEYFTKYQICKTSLSFGEDDFELLYNNLEKNIQLISMVVIIFLIYLSALK